MSIPILTPAQFRKKYYNLSYADPLYTDSFNINRIDNKRLKYPIEVHRKTMHDFFLLTKGNSDRHKGIDKYTVGSNMFFLMPAYQITGSDYMSSDAEGYYCRFTDDFLLKLISKKEFVVEFPFFQFTANPVVKIEDPEILSQLEHTLERISILHKEHQAGWQDCVAAYLVSIFYELKRLTNFATEKSNSAASRITEEFKQALYTHFYEKQKVGDYADLLSVSPNHLNKCIKLSTGKSAQELIEEMIVLESKVLLRQSSLSISDVAYALNRTPTGFGRLFRNSTGLSPSEYRAKD